MTHPDSLVPVDTYASTLLASLACARLADHDIDAVVADSAIADTAWHLSVATGGVKLLVREADLEQARAILAEPVEPLDDDADVGALGDAEADAAAGDDDVSPAVDEALPVSPYAERPKPRDDLLTRARTAAVLGLIFMPLQVYSLWLLIRAWRDKVSRPTLTQTAVVLLLNGPLLLVVWLVMSLTLARHASPSDIGEPVIIDDNTILIPM